MCGSTLTPECDFRTVATMVKQTHGGVVPLDSSSKLWNVRSAATHLLRVGADLSAIRVWLGHIKLDATNIEAHIDFEAKTRNSEQARRRRDLARHKRPV